MFTRELGGEESGLVGESRTMTCSGAGGCWGPGPRISKMSGVALPKTGARGRGAGPDGAGSDGAGPDQEKSSQEAVECRAGPVSSLDGVVIGLWSLDPKHPKVWVPHLTDKH